MKTLQFKDTFAFETDKSWTWRIGLSAGFLNLPKSQCNKLGTHRFEIPEWLFNKNYDKIKEGIRKHKIKVL